MDGMVSLSAVPLKVASWMGIALCVASFLTAGLFIAWWLSDLTLMGNNPKNAVGWTNLVMLFLFLSGCTAIDHWNSWRVCRLPV